VRGKEIKIKNERRIKQEHTTKCETKRAEKRNYGQKAEK
jgi:hypothetical protein